MTTILAEEPDKIQLHYCLGLLNHELKGDTQRAIDEYEAFLGSPQSGQYERERSLVEKWLPGLHAQG